MASKFAYRYRKPVASVGVGVRTSATEDDASSPTIPAGSGAPSAAEPNGSVYLRTDASTAAESVYSRIGGSWVAIDGDS